MDYDWCGSIIIVITAKMKRKNKKGFAITTMLIILGMLFVGLFAVGNIGGFAISKILSGIPWWLWLLIFVFTYKIIKTDNRSQT